MTVNRAFERPDSALIQALSAQSATMLHEMLGKRGAMSSGIRPLAVGTKLCGPALTVSCGSATDNLMTHLALALAQPGDVLVVDMKGIVDSGSWGDLMTLAAKVRGIAGLVIDGSVRDTATIREMGFPVFSRGVCMKGTTKTQTNGDVGVAITCGGVLVEPGDIILGDDDGVVVVPKADAATALEKAIARDAWENDVRRKLEAGVTTIDALNLGGPLKAAGIEW